MSAETLRKRLAEAVEASWTESEGMLWPIYEDQHNAELLDHSYADLKTLLALVDALDEWFHDPDPATWSRVVTWREELEKLP